ncbi:hypothetical protein [Flavobacterium sp. N502536]|uniref:hypothetical protein n=1 Tax=Flavobacterium sp. N502536 TaxID=2986837 RepID=UPI0022216587|nr:hypothetical protein [Flavobacterium sp. N502536]
MATLKKKETLDLLTITDLPNSQAIIALFKKYSDAFHLKNNTELSLENCSLILNAILYSHKVQTTKDKLEIIDAIDSIKKVQERIALKSGKISKEEIEKAAKSLGQKVQSSLED